MLYKTNDCATVQCMYVSEVDNNAHWRRLWRWKHESTCRPFLSANYSQTLLKYLFSFLVTRYYHCEASEGFRVFKNLVMFTNFYYFTRKSNSSSTSGHIILNFTTFHLAGHLLMWDDGSSIKPAKHGLANFTPHCETSQPPVFQLNLPNVAASNISPNKNNACH